MRVHILGSAAGGGLPQWNCNCANCAAVRSGTSPLQPRTQSSVAISADQRHWFVLNVSPDIRQQILNFPELGPNRGESRGTAIAGCILTDAEIDHTAGLLLLREGCAFTIMSTPLVRQWLNAYLPFESILASFASRPWMTLELQREQELLLPDGTPSGLRASAFPLDDHVPRFVKEHSETLGSVVGLRIHDVATGGILIYAPCVGSLSSTLRDACANATCILLDGTFWSDDELVRLKVSERSARQMGHIPVHGAEGSLQWLGDSTAKRRAYVHINNTNPMLDPRRPEHHLVVERGVLVGSDGDTFEL